MEPDIELQDLAIGACEWLDGAWWIDLDWDGHGVVLRGPAGERLFMHRLWDRKERVEVSGSVPCDYQDPNRWTGYGGVHITVAISRGPEALVREIKRRLLPAYLPKLAEAVRGIEQDIEHAAWRETWAAQLTEALAAATGCEITRGRYDASYKLSLHWYRSWENRGSGLGSGDIEISHYGTDVKITGASPDVVLRLLQGIALPAVHA